MPLTESQYVPNGRQQVNAFSFSDDGKHVLSLDVNGRIVWVGNLTTTPVEILAWNPTEQWADFPTGIRMPRYTNATRPAFGTAGRMIYNTDLNSIQIDNGTGWDSFSSVSNPVTIGQGGTGQVTAAAGLAALGGIATSLLTTRGDIIVRGAAVPERKALGAKGALLTSDGTDPQYQAVGADGHMVEAASGVSNGLQWSMPADFGHGRLTFVSATSLKFLPFNGQKLPVKTSGTWRLRDISSAGVVSANPTTASNFVGGVAATQLAASTTYLVTVFDNSGTLTFDFISTLTHAADTTTGVEIKNGDDTRTVVGMIRTDASRQFQATETLVLSWFNRRRKVNRTSFTAARSTGSATFVEVNTEIRNDFLVWSGCLASMTIDGFASSATNDLINTGFGIDDATPENTTTRGRPTAGGEVSTAVMFEAAQSEGYHFATLVGRTGAGTATWAGGAEPERCHLQVIVEG